MKTVTARLPEGVQETLWRFKDLVSFTRKGRK